MRSKSTTITGEVSKFYNTGDRLVGVLFISIMILVSSVIGPDKLISRSVAFAFLIILIIFILEQVQSSSYSPASTSFVSLF